MSLQRGLSLASLSKPNMPYRERNRHEPVVSRYTPAPVSGPTRRSRLPRNRERQTTESKILTGHRIVHREEFEMNRGQMDAPRSEAAPIFGVAPSPPARDPFPERRDPNGQEARLVRRRTASLGPSSESNASSRKSDTPRLGLEPRSKAPEASRISTTLPGHPEMWALIL